MFCPYCCAKIPADEIDDSTKCLECGRDLGGVMDKSDCQCGSCGAECPEDAEYCWSCGEKLEKDR
jgi:hypothetical protein